MPNQVESNVNVRDIFYCSLPSLFCGMLNEMVLGNSVGSKSGQMIKANFVEGEINCFIVFIKQVLRNK